MFKKLVCKLENQNLYKGKRSYDIDWRYAEKYGLKLSLKIRNYSITKWEPKLLFPTFCFLVPG